VTFKSEFFLPFYTSVSSSPHNNEYRFSGFVSVGSCQFRSYFEVENELSEKCACVLIADGNEPVSRPSFHHAKQKFLGLVRQTPPMQQKLSGDDDDDDMLVPDG